MATPGANELALLLNIDDIERAARRILSPKAESYYPSASDDELTKRWNNHIFRQIHLRPRVFVDVGHCDLTTTVLGCSFGIPIFIAPAAAARLAHQDGEAAMAAACSSFNALHIISHNASMAPIDIVRSGRHGQVFGWQLYVLKDIRRTEATLAKIRENPEIKFIVLTLDAPFPGKREADERFKMGELAGGGSEQTWGTEGRLTWQSTLEWLSRQTHLPIVLKGIQTHEDACLATRFPTVKGIILSNHGGRALDTAQPPLQTLLEIRKHCPEVLTKLDVLLDGGIKRGTDVVKAIALGAKAVGIGRAPLYGLVLGGRRGVERTLQILADETQTAMSLLGVSKIEELNSSHINTRRLDSLLVDDELATRVVPLANL